MNKKFGRIILFFIISLCAFSYEFYTFIPDKIVYINGKPTTPFGVLGNEYETSQNGSEKLKLFGIVPYKSVSVDVIENDTVILGGNSIGIDINTDGILVLGFSDFYGADGKKHCPAKDAGLKKGDIIKSVNDIKIETSENFVNIIDESKNNDVTIKYERNGKEHTAVLTPVKSSEDNIYHIGLWARDGSSGIGTLTFIYPETNKFAALGHSITDADTNETVKLGGGSIYFSAVTDIQKGKSGFPGEMHGCYISSQIGSISKNTDFGIYGEYYGTADDVKTIKVASRNEITEGDAVMLCCTDGNTVGAYSIRIEKINIGSYDNKSMIIRITDKELIEKTGGIIQGMSGSPIVQNGKLVGAVTHVLINNPTKGYGIFIENMLAETEKISD